MSDREDFGRGPRGIGQVMMYGAPPLDQAPTEWLPGAPIKIDAGPFQGGASLPTLGIVDPEFVAVHAVLDAIKALDMSAQERVLDYVLKRVCEGAVQR